MRRTSSACGAPNRKRARCNGDNHSMINDSPAASALSSLFVPLSGSGYRGITVGSGTSLVGEPLFVGDIVTMDSRGNYSIEEKKK